MCYIYFYSYAPDYAEAPSSTWQPRGIPHEESPIVPQAPQPTSTTMEDDHHSEPPMDVDNKDNKRDGPET